MAYFLPSYFQKRLLRYALGRLDFIDSEALDLNNLDITIGQRSVIELKNVGVKVSKLLESAQLPSAVTVQHATIRVLRITIPADLHVSGIEVEVDGVDVEVSFDTRQKQEDHKTTSAGTSRAPSHRDIANRPRLASPAVHDPGGYSHRSRGSGTPDIHVLPTSEDLAQSFLADEPEEERRELEAVVESSSIYIQQASRAHLDASSHEEELGLNEGFSLPGFVADFFHGVAERLSVVVKNTSILLALLNATDLPGQEPVKFMLVLDEFRLQAISATSEPANHQPLRKTLTLANIGLFVLSGWDQASSQSAASSPGLFRSRTRTSQASSYISLPRSSHSESVPPASPSTSRSSDLAQFGLGMTGPALASSDIFRSTLSDHHPEMSRNTSPESNRSARQEPTLSSSSGRSSNADLAESRLFSHHEAESMYMSAMSGGHQSHAMPGGWGSSDYTNAPDHTSVNSQPASSIRTELQESASRPTNVSPKLSEALEPDRASPSLQRRDQDRFNSGLVGKHLLSIDSLTLRLPPRVHTMTVEETEEDHLAYGTPPKPRHKPRTMSSTLGTRATSSHGRESSAHSIYGEFSIADVSIDASGGYEVEVDKVSISIDTSLCHLLLRSTSAVTEVLSSRAEQSTTPTQHSDLFAMFKLNSLDFYFFQQVEELPLGKFNGISQNQQRLSDKDFQAALLSMKIRSVRHQLARTAHKTDQELIIHRLTVGKGSDQLISFVDPASLNESFVASSMMVSSDDIVLRRSNERVHILAKPIHVSLDLVLMDDVLSRSGGLSSLLDLGGSIASVGTVKEKTVSPPRSSLRSRSVRFDNEDDPITTAPKGESLKVDARIAGAIIDLVGSESAIQVKTSSIKLISRSYGFRSQVSSISVKGPRLLRAPSPGGLSIRLTGFKFDFSDKPNEQDLERLMSLVTPSSDKYDVDDDIMVDTLMRQRRKGSVVRLSLEECQVMVNGTAWTGQASQLVDELARLSSVAKYLPEDDRPGVLVFMLVRKIQLQAELSPSFGPITFKADLLEGAQISVPSLLAAQVSTLELFRGRNERILCELVPNMHETDIMGPPMLMCRFIADEMEPTIKVKLSHLCLHYTVPLVVAITKLVEELQVSQASGQGTISPRASNLSHSSSETSEFARKVRVSITLRTSGVALSPVSSSASAIFLFNNAVFGYVNKHKTLTVTADLRKASFLIIDDVTRVGINDNVDSKLYFDQNDHVQELTKSGYVPVGTLSATTVVVKIAEDIPRKASSVDVELSNAFFTLETCADSFQTLIQILNDISPPSEPSRVAKYRTEVIPIDDMLASFTGDAFVSEPVPELGLQAHEAANSSASLSENSNRLNSPDIAEEDDDTFLNDLFLSQAEEAVGDQMTESYLESEVGHTSTHGSITVAPVNITADDDSKLDQSIMMHSLLDLQDQHFIERTSVGGTAHRWDASKNTYDMGSERTVALSPLKVRVRNVHVIWNLFDGYDWQNTRTAISEAVQQVEEKAMAKRKHRDSGRSPVPDEEEESVVGDVLFNSIYISIPTSKDPRGLTDAINMDIGDAMSETGSYATSTTITATPSKKSFGPRPKTKRLRLKRSRQHKMTFELEGVSADFLMFPPGSGEVESSLDIRVKKLDIFDHVPTSTWKKFATYMHEAGEREVNTDMVHIEVLNVKPVAELSASEMVLKLSVLPLRLHVDQDALDFMTRFFEFKDDRNPPSTTPSAPPFIQRAEVQPIKLRLDFKPKRVNYAGIRSGRTSEFMNFFILDRADIVLRRIILYGVSGLDRLGLMLHAIWSPDVTSNQLPTVLAGLAPVRSLVDVGSGVRDLIAIPIREYKKDGRVVRSIQKGAMAFAKTTTTELVNLGAKLAIGTQTVLQNAEGVLAPNSPNSPSNEEDEPRKQVSLYADQPLGIVAGLRSAYTSLERDLLLARDAIVAVPGEVMADPSATGAAKAVIKQSPTIILRPAIGVTKAVGQAFLGAGNTLDKGNKRRIDEKYKRY